MHHFGVMVGMILFFAVAMVGVLSVWVMAAVAWRRFRTERDARERVRARQARLAEAAILRAEHAAVLSQLAPRPTAKAAAVSLTSVFARLEESTPFVREPAPPKTRFAKGSIPMPMVDGRTGAPVTPIPSLVRPSAVPPPIPSFVRSSAVPPPIPGTRRRSS